jgi:hypothetical protein
MSLDTVSYDTSWLNLDKHLECILDGKLVRFAIEDFIHMELSHNSFYKLIFKENNDTFVVGPK